MKKVLSILAVIAIAASFLTFAGCGQKAEDTVLDMATNAAFPPYEFKGDDGNFAGIDIEIAEKIAEKLGMTLKVHDVDFDTIISGVQTNKFDMGMAGMTVTEERQKSVNFSKTYATGVQAVIVKADSEYTSYEDFYTGFEGEGDDMKPAGTKQGIKIGVQQGTTGDIYCSDVPAKWGFGMENVTQYKTGAEAVEALKGGKVTAVIIDNEPAKSFVAANEGLKILEGAYTEEDYAICVAKKNTELLDKINKALDELIADGTVAAIVEKYIPSNTADEK